MKFCQEGVRKLLATGRRVIYPDFVPHIVVAFECRQVMGYWDNETVAVDKLFVQCT